MNQFFKTHLSYLIRYSLLALFTLIPWVSYSQSVSIGLPIDGAEGSANGSFTVSLDGGGVNTTGNAITGLINYSGSAYYASDFVGAVSFSIPDGIGSVSIPISVLDDHFLELDETVNVSISGLSAGTIGSGTSTLTISDDDLAQLQVSVESLHNRIEGTGHLSFTVFFEGDVENLTGSVITGDISYSGTATNGTDYTLSSTSFSLGFGMSSTNIPAFVTDDVLVESPETVTATISNLSVGTVLNTSSTATILDDDSGDALVSIGFLNHGVEGSSDVSFLVFMPNGGVNTTGAPISGTISYTGTAIDGVDYSGPSSFSIPAGASVDTIDIVVLDDAIQEPNETIIATISNVNTGYIVNETRDALIADDDAQSLVISMTSPADAVEGTSDVIFNVFLEGGVINNSGAPITGTFFFLNSSALFGADFAPLNGFSIPVGASSTTVTLTVYDDPILEPTEIIDILIVGLNIGAPGNTMAQAQIIDDDSGQYSLSMSQLTNGVEGASDMEFTVSLDNGVINTSGAPITGSINYSGSANPFNDCLSTPSAFSIPNGSNSTQITIPIYDDILVECDESLTAMIDDPNIGSIGTDSDVAYIIDDECALAVVSIHSPSDGAELGSDVEFIVSFDGNVLNGTGAVISGTLDLSGGTAIPGVDFVNQQTFQIGIGVNSTTVSIPVIDEFDIEATESVVATISNISFGVIGTNTSTAFIADNDSVSGIHPVESIDLSVFPNPMNNLLSLRAENHIKHYRILDAKGMVISDGEIEAKTADVDVEFLSSGVYVINVLFENGNSLNRKLVKE